MNIQIFSLIVFPWFVSVVTGTWSQRFEAEVTWAQALEQVGYPLFFRNLALFGGIGIAMVLLNPLGGDTSSLFLLVVAIICVMSGLWHVSWLWRKPGGGDLLLSDVVTSEAWKYVSFAVCVLVFLFVFFGGLLWQIITLTQGILVILLYGSLIISSIIVGLSKFELRQQGICHHLTFVPWQRIKTYKFMFGQFLEPDSLILELKYKSPLRLKSRTIKFPSKYRPAVAEILRQYLPERELPPCQQSLDTAGYK
jgi:hypothetical protein